MRRVVEAFSILWDLIIGAWAVLVILILGVVAILTLAILVRAGHVQTGFSGKTLWDWMETFGVPVVAGVIAVGGAIWVQRAGQRAQQERERDTERTREVTLREYLDRMSDLILNHKLQESPEDSPARAVADARTFGALRSLDGPRKGILVRFLYESKLIAKDKRVVSLDLADLRGSDLSYANLEGSDLSGANLGDADFFNANLRDANLLRSVVSPEQLMDAADLVGATLPDEDGTVMTEDRWKTFKTLQL